MSQASLVLRANSWKLEAFLDFRLLNLGFWSLGYLMRDRQPEREMKKNQLSWLKAALEAKHTELQLLLSKGTKHKTSAANATKKKDQYTVDTA